MVTPAKPQMRVVPEPQVGDSVDYPNKYLDRRTGKIMTGAKKQDYMNHEIHDSLNCFFHPHEHILLLQFWKQHGKLPEE